MYLHPPIRPKSPHPAIGADNDAAERVVSVRAAKHSRRIASRAQITHTASAGTDRPARSPVGVAARALRRTRPTGQDNGRRLVFRRRLPARAASGC